MEKRGGPGKEGTLTIMNFTLNNFRLRGILHSGEDAHKKLMSGSMA